MTRFSRAGGVAAALALCASSAWAHPWHRHREPAAEPAAAVAASTAAGARAAAPFLLTAAPQPARGAVTDIAAAFAPFEKLEAIATRSDDRWFYVESNGIPNHPLMVGIRSWQQQVPLPQPYTGDNAWRIPLHPVPAAEPVTTKGRFLRGAIALAVNGIPIFNPLNNRNEDAFAVGELDDFGGHCGRGDDYHYHIAPVHLEKIVGRGKPIAWALDGYPIYGTTEPDGSPVRGLDWMGGHEDAAGNYHYHAQKQYPYLNGGFRGEVTEREGQVDPQPRARGVREALPPLRGATIVAFKETKPGTRLLTYEVEGRKGTVEYTVQPNGAAVFTFTDTAGRKTSETYQPRGGGGGGGRRDGPPGDRPPPRGDRPPPPRDGGPPGGPGPGGRPPELPAAGRAPAAGALAPTSPAIGPDGNLPVEFTCDGAGVSPPLEWKAGPAGTKSYALVLWHEAPDQVKSYWVVHGIPAGVTRLDKGARDVGTFGLNDKRRADYDPMCSKGPGLKTYHVTVYALAAEPSAPAGGMTRATLLEAVRGTTLAEGTLTFTYERRGRP
ncbi:MAG: YHYH protein [Planctomycetia bacterium]